MAARLQPLGERASSELRQILDRQMTEPDLQAAVVEMAQTFGWLHYHTFDSRRSSEGFPDLVLVRAPQVVFAELKAEKGKALPDQVRWSEALTACALFWSGNPSTRGSLPVRYFVWRPSDWSSGRIEEVLRP